MGINAKKIRRYIHLNGVKVWITADSEQEYAEQIMKLMGGSQPAATTKHLFQPYAENWFAVFSKPNITTVTALTYERQLRLYIYPVLGEKAIEDITPSDVQQVFNRMPEGSKQWTKAKVKIVLNQIFKMAIEDGYILRNPLQSTSVRVKGQAASTTKPYTVEQMRYLVAHLKDITDPTDRAWLTLSISLPLRPEEVLGLKWKDVDTEKCILHIRGTVTHPKRNMPEYKPYTKTASSVRDLAFPKEILCFLSEKGPDDEFVVGGKSPISYTQLRRMRSRIVKQIDFDEPLTPRRFRTTVATDISDTTHDLKLVQQMLGHATPQMTLKHYVKGRNDSVDASEAIGKCYGFTGS